MKLSDLRDNVVGERSALEIAYRSLPLAFQGLAGEELVSAVGNIVGNSAEDIFGTTSTEIVDIDGRLLFRGFYSTLRDDNTIEVLVSADTRLGSPIGSIGIRRSRRRSAESIGLALKAFGHAGVSLDSSSKALVCYDYPSLAVRGKRGDLDVVIDINDRSIFSVAELKAMGALSPLVAVDRSSEWRESIAFLDGIWFGKSTVQQCAVQTMSSSCYSFDLNIQSQMILDYCVPAVALTLLKYLGFTTLSLEDVADAMKTVVGDLPNRGTLLDNEVRGYSLVTGGKITARSEIGPIFANAKAKLGTAANPGLPLKAGTSIHAFAVAGWSDAMGGQLSVYDPMSSGGASWKSIAIFKNLVYIDS